MMHGIRHLSADLKPIVELELRLGNAVERIEEENWTICSYGVVMQRPLHVNEIKRELKLPPTVRDWDNDDTHYPLEIGYFCETMRHSVSGPKPKKHWWQFWS